MIEAGTSIEGYTARGRPAFDADSADGVSEVFGTTAVAIGDAYARAAFARPAQVETFLDKPFSDDAQKALKDVDAAGRFWSTQELSRKFADPPQAASSPSTSEAPR